MVGGGAHGTTDFTQIGISVLAMIPVYGGMVIGRRIRHRQTVPITTTIVPILILLPRSKVKCPSMLKR